MLTVTLQLTEEEAELLSGIVDIYWCGRNYFDEEAKLGDYLSLERKVKAATALAQQVRKLNPDSDWVESE